MLRKLMGGGGTAAKDVVVSSSEPSFEELAQILKTLTPQQQSEVSGLLGTAIGDAVGLPFELHAHAKNRRSFDVQQSSANAAARFWDHVLPFMISRLQRSGGTPFGRTFSDDTVCTDLKMQVIAKVLLSCAPAKVGEDAIFEAMLQEYLAWANNAEGNLFQGYGGFTKDLLRPSRNRFNASLWKPNSDFLPTEEYKRFAKEHFQGIGGEPSWGNGAVMSITPQVLMQSNGAGAAKELSATHLEASAVLAAELLSEVLGMIHVKKLSTQDMAKVLSLASWRKLTALVTQDRYVYPIAAFEEFLTTGDCKVDTANAFLLELITRSGLACSEADLVGHRPPAHGNFGEMLRIAANYDDDPAHHGIRLSVENQPEVMVRFSQRALNTVLIAMWCATAAKTSVDWLQRVIYVGGDTDTVGAVAGQIACPLLDVNEVLEVYRRSVALPAAVNDAAARRFAYRCCLFVSKKWSQLLQCPRLVDPAYEGITTEDGMRLKGHCRTPCKFGGKCYDQKKGHRAQYSHPGDVDWQRLPCRYAARGCRDRSEGHALEYSHPGDFDWEARGRMQI